MEKENEDIENESEWKIICDIHFPLKSSKRGMYRIISRCDNYQLKSESGRSRITIILGDRQNLRRLEIKKRSLNEIKSSFSNNIKRHIS